MTSNVAPAPGLSITRCFGLKSDVKDCACFFDDTNLMYAAGHNVILHDLFNKSQKFIPGLDLQPGADKGSGITAMCLSPNKRFLAVAESGAVLEKASISVFDMFTLRRKKLLSVKEVENKDSYPKMFVCIAFSHDSKMLVAQGCGPDYLLMYWSWEKSKALATVISTNVKKSPVYQCTFNPSDNALVYTVGEGSARLYKYADGQMKQVAGSAAKREGSQNYLSAAWLSPERLVAGTDSGELVLFEMAELKLTLPQSPGSGMSIHCIVPHAKGFIIGGSGCQVHMYERTEEKEVYKRVKSHAPSADARQSTVRSMSLSPNEETVACITSDHQCFTMSLSGPTGDITRNEPQSSELWPHGHTAAITGLDIAVRKPLVVTGSIDKTVRVWNYATQRLELTKTFQSECLSVTFHPSGFHIVAGFADKLRFLNLLLDDINTAFEYDIRGCKECKFSTGGQYFAVVNNNVIQIYSSYTFLKIAQLKSHTHKVRSLYWAPEDNEIVSTGMDGCVYTWAMKDGKRIGDCVVKTCDYSCVVCSDGAKSIFAVGSDCKLREMDMTQVQQEFDCNFALTQLALSSSGRLFFAGTDVGTLRSYKFPLNGEFSEFHMHCGTVTRIVLSPDNTCLFSAGEDGVLFISEIKDKDGRSHVKARREAEFSEEALIGRGEMEEKNSVVGELRTKYDDMIMQHEYQSKLTEINNHEKIAEQTKKHASELVEWSRKYTVLTQSKVTVEHEHELRLAELERQLNAKLVDLDTSYRAKLAEESERFNVLRDEKDVMLAKNSKDRDLMQKTHEEQIAAIYEENARTVGKVQEELNSANEAKNQLKLEFDETRTQLEEDADREIEEQKEVYEEKLAAERQASLRLKDENSMMKKKFSTLQKEIDNHKEEIGALFEKKRQLTFSIQMLEKESLVLRKEIKERDETIAEKEKRIYELKKKNTELEKFKFVLGYKMTELKKQMEPLHMEIAEQKEQIKEMDKELERHNKNQNNLELMINDYKMKIATVNKEVAHQKKRCNAAETMCRRFRTDLHECMQHIQEPKNFKESIKKLYQKHVDVQVQEEVGLDSAIQQEYNRQREYLESTVLSLRKKLAKDTEMHKADYIRIMQENVSLIAEINSLRREMKALKQSIKEKDLNLLVANQGKDGEEDRSDYESSLDYAKMVEMQRSEMMKMRERILDLESNATTSLLAGTNGLSLSRPSSGTRLPPLSAGSPTVSQTEL